MHTFQRTAHKKFSGWTCSMTHTYTVSALHANWRRKGWGHNRAQSHKQVKAWECVCDELTHRSKALGREYLSEKCHTLLYCQLLEGHFKHTYTHTCSKSIQHTHAHCWKSKKKKKEVKWIVLSWNIILEWLLVFTVNVCKFLVQYLNTVI